MEIRNVNVLVRKVIVRKEEHISFRDLLLRLCVRKKIYVKARKGIQRSKHYLFTTFKRVFLILSFFKVGEPYSSKSTAPILLKFYTLFLHIKYEVMLSSFLIFYNYNLFHNNKISDFLNEKSVF